MDKKLVCFDKESLQDLDLLQALFKMNRSQVIRFLLREKVQDIQETHLLTKNSMINQTKSKDIPNNFVGGVDEV